MEHPSIQNKREKETIEWPRNGMDRLPREVALDILSRLPVSSLIRFSYSSQSWKMLSFDPHLVNLHLSRSAMDTTCLILRCGNQLHFVEFSDHNEKAVVRKFEPPFPTPMPEINVVGSCNGLICLSNSKNRGVIHLFNPFTRSFKQLPETKQFHDQLVVVGFGFHPMTNEYKVVRIVYHQNVNERYSRRVICGYRYVYPQSEVQVHSGGGNEWRCIGEMPYQIEPRISESIYLNGRLHWLTRSSKVYGFDRMIISFDLVDEQFREVALPDCSGSRMLRCPFAVLGGCLSVLVCPRRNNIEIWVMKEYGVTESWSKDFEIDFYYPIPNFHFLSVLRALCLMKNGEILLLHDGALISYDPKSRELKNVMFEGMPKCFQIIEHVGSLVSIDNAVCDELAKDACYGIAEVMQELVRKMELVADGKMNILKKSH